MVIDFDFRGESATAAFVAIPSRIQAGVALVEPLNGQFREAHPCGIDCTGFADLECQSSNRQRVGSGADAEIDVDNAIEIAHPLAIAVPMILLITADLKLGRFRADDHTHVRLLGSPASIAHHRKKDFGRLLVLDGQNPTIQQKTAGVFQQAEVLQR